MFYCCYIILYVLVSMETRLVCVCDGWVDGVPVIQQNNNNTHTHTDTPLWHAGCHGDQTGREAAGAVTQLVAG